MLIKDYQPRTHGEWHNFFVQNAWLYSVLLDKITVSEGRRFVLEEKEQSNAHRVIKKL